MPVRRYSGMLLLLLAGPLAADSVEQWVARMDTAMASISYRGTMVSIAGNRVDTLKVVHRVDDQGVRERIHALDGIPRELLRDRDSVLCLIDGQASLLVDNPFPRRLLARIALQELVGENSAYRLRKGGTERIAGRDTRILEIEPLDDHRFGRRLWLDELTGLPLRSVAYDRGGRVVEKLSFVEIELDAEISDQELASELAGVAKPVRLTDSDPGIAANPAPSWLPDHLPPGFRLASVGSTGEGEQRDEHLLFSDGLASFSIYVEVAADSPVAEHLESRGATHLYTAMRDGRTVTVVGEVPASTVHFVGRELRRLMSTRSPIRD